MAVANGHLWPTPPRQIPWHKCRSATKLRGTLGEWQSRARPRARWVRHRSLAEPLGGPRDERRFQAINALSGHTLGSMLSISLRGIRTCSVSNKKTPFGNGGRRSPATSFHSPLEPASDCSRQCGSALIVRMRRSLSFGVADPYCRLETLFRLVIRGPCRQRRLTRIGPLSIPLYAAASSLDDRDEREDEQSIIHDAFASRRAEDGF